MGRPNPGASSSLLFLQGGFVEAVKRFSFFGSGIRMRILNLVTFFESSVITISFTTSLNFIVRGFSKVSTPVMGILRDARIFSISLLSLSEPTLF